MKPTSLANRAVGAFERIRKDQLGPECLQNELALGARVRGDAQLHFIAARRSNHRVRDAGIARRRVQNREAGTERARFLPLRNHARGGAILDRTARVLPFDFGANLDARTLLFELTETNERCAADQIEDGNANGRCDR